MPIASVDVSRGAARRLPAEVAALALGDKGLLLTDEIVFDALRHDIHPGWLAGGLDLRSQVLKGKVVPNEEAIGRVICGIPQDTDYLVTVGGGTVTDLGRYVGSRLRLPVVAVPSTMSMDGFFTNMSVIIIDGLQHTLYLDYPVAVLADTDLISQCPPTINSAGVGEVIAKVSAGLDWFAAHQVKDVHYCPTIAELMGSCISVGSSEATVEGLPQSDRDALADLSDGLYRSAVGMSWYAASVCGSGGEHLLNHFWMMCQDNRGVPQSMHGRAVGSGAVVDLMVWEEIMKLDLTRLPHGIGPGVDEEHWKNEIRRVYGDMSGEILALQAGNHLFDECSRHTELARVRDRAAVLRERFEATPSADELARKLRKAGTAASPRELGITRQEFIDSVLYAKEMRTGRYNSLWLADSLGHLEQIAESVAARLGYDAVGDLDARDESARFDPAVSSHSPADRGRPVGDTTPKEFVV